MPDRLPSVDTRRFITALVRLGFEELPGRGKGSHHALWKEGLRRPLIVPDRKALDPGFVRRLLRSAEVDEQQFRDALR